MISRPPKGNDAKVLGSYFSPLKAEAQAVPNMTVQVSAGSFWLVDKTHQEYIGGTSPTIFAPSLPSTAWWVIITITPDGTLNVVEGLPAAAPVLPDPADYAGELPVAAIYLVVGTTAITNELIYDIRPLWAVQADSVSQSELDDYYTKLQVDNRLLLKADTTGTSEATFKLNVSGTPMVDYSGIEVRRTGFDDGIPDVGIRFSEEGSPAEHHWEFTNDGVVWDHIGVASDNYYTKVQSDALYTPIAHATDYDLHMTTDQNSFFDGLILGGSPASLQPADVNALIGITGNVQSQIDTHIADDTVHLTTVQNTFLDGLDLAGSPALTAAEVNFLTGVTSNVQLQLDGKVDDVVGTTGNIIVKSAIAGELEDSGWTLNDAGGSPSANDLWSANKIDTEINSAVAALGATKIDTVPAAVVGNLPVFIAGGQLTDSGDSIASLTASLSGLFVDLTTAQLVGGNKNFSDNITIDGDLTVNGTTTTVNTQNLTVEDKNIHMNYGYSGATSGSDGAGLTIDRNTTGGSPPVAIDPAATLIWHDTTERWQAGLDGSEDVVALEGVTVAQPFYELVAGLGASPAVSDYDLSFNVPAPAAGQTGIQVFVNGIKQVEGASKSYQVIYGTVLGGSPEHVRVVFQPGSEPVTGADVEFYGFGYIG
jgi:hypothetical protein